MQFPVKPLAYGLALMAGAGLLGACGGGSNNDGPRIQVSPANAYLLTSNNRIIGVDLDDTEFARQGSFLGNGGFGVATNNVPRGDSTFVENALEINEEILAIDYRNSEGQLYALTRLEAEGRIIIITPTTGEVTRVSTLIADGTTTKILLSTTASYTIDFNPTVDRLRIIGSDDTNFRADALTGETFTDGTISIASATIAGVAYTDVFAAANGRTTTLFGIDTDTDALYPFSSANAGTLGTARSLGVGDVTRVNGFDINPSSSALSAVLTVGGQTSLYSINANSGAASRISSLPALPGSETYKSLALVTQANPTVIVLDNANTLSVLRANDPTQVFSPGSVTLPNSETLIGIDFRQSSRTLNGLSNAGNHYALSVPVNGMAGPTAMLINTPAPAMPTPLTNGVAYTTDFNPTSGMGINRLRLIGDNDENAVVEIETGSRTANASISGMPDPTVVAAAYSNNFRNAASTQLFVVDRTSNSIATQTVTAPTAPATTPAVGQLVNPIPLSITLSGSVGFDISGRNNDNILLMARTAAGPHTLYRVNFGLGDRLLPLGSIGGTTGPSNLIDMAITF